MKNYSVYSVKVKPRSKTEGVSVLGDKRLEVRVRAIPEKGRASARVIEMLSQELGVAKSNIHIIRGETAREKIIAVSE